MTVGTHVVKLYRNSPPWGSVLNTNAQFSNGLTGWQSAPFEQALGWAVDGWVVQTRGGSVNRAQTDANPLTRLPGDRWYRLRTRVTFPVATNNVGLGLFLGNTVENAWRGAFWAGVANATDVMAPRRNYAAGTWEIQDDVWVPASLSPTHIYAGVTLQAPYRSDTSQGSNRVDYLEVTSLAASDVADISCWVDEVSIRHGRSDTTSQPDPSSATVDLSWDNTEAALPALVEIGASVYVTTTVSGVERPRFVGRVTDVALGWDEAGADTPNTEAAQIAAVGTMADLGRRVVGDTPYPVENDAQRVGRVATAAGMALDLMVSDPGAVNVRARDIDSQAALSVMRETAESAMGMVWQALDGTLRYMDLGHRRNVAVGVELDACDVLVSPTWTRNLDGVVNAVALGYGEGSGGTQARYVATNPSSQTKWGPYAYTKDTELAALADATAIGQLLMVRNYQPIWILSAIPVDVAGLSATNTDRLLSLDVSDLLHLTGLPAIGSAPTDLYMWVEGFTERLGYGTHELELVVSDYCRTSGLVRWDDPTVMTWNTAPAGKTWDESYCVGYPGPGVGRWDDTPTSLRWDQVAPATTWDTWVQPTVSEAA